MRKVNLALMALVIALLGGAASAGELRIYGRNAETSSSRCIGDPKTPYCAVETVDACFLWSDPKLCAAVNARHPPSASGLPAELQASNFLYEFVGEKILSAEEAAHFSNYTDPHLPHADPKVDSTWWWACSWGREPCNPPRAGDTVLRVWSWSCDVEEKCNDESRADPNREPGEGCPIAQCSRFPAPDAYFLRWDRVKWVFLIKYSDEDLPATLRYHQ